MKVDAGEAQPVTALDTNELHHSWPQVIGGGRALLHTAWNNSGFDGARILVRPITGGEPTVLVEGASHARVVRARGGSAYLVYARAEGVLAAPFDEETLRVAGAAVPVQHAIQTNLSGGAHFSVSDTGLLAYVQGTMNELDKTLVWVDPTGAATDIATITGLSFNYRLSPDGRRIVRPNTSGGDRDLWVDDLEGRGPPRRLTFGGVHNTPIWTPDGSRVIYASGVPRGNLFWKAADGSGAEERLSSSAHAQMPGSVSPDGGTLAYTQIAGDQQPPDIWLMSLREPREVRRFVSTPLADIRPTFSPDGRWLAYSSNVSGRFEVYVTSLPDGDRQIPVSNGGGYLPLWSRDGRELYYRTTSTESITGNVMAATFDADAPEPVRGTRPLFAAPYQGDGGVAPDGRFLYLQPTPQVSTARVIHVVVNWTDELAAIVQGR
ncbi:MAG: PD40 domain-containing protein [Acidobacteria bacterium]|nr:PD40 domain-containing protein [Acidobacteriota bacterium]